MIDIFKRKKPNLKNVSECLEKKQTPEVVTKQKERQLRQEKAKEEFIKQQENLFAKLNAVGVEINSNVKEVIKASNEARMKALPILLKHIGTEEYSNYSKRVKESLIRTLGSKKFKGLVTLELIKLFENEEDDKTRWTIGNAINDTADEAYVDEIIHIIEEKEKYGGSRSMLVHTVARVKGEGAAKLLLELLSDEDKGVYSQAIIALGDVKCIEAKGKIESFLNNSDPWVRQQAKAALKKINNASKGTLVQKKNYKKPFLDLRHEASMNFDSERLESFLIGLDKEFNFNLDIHLISEFTSFVAEIKSENTLGIDIEVNGEATKANYHVYMDDIDSLSIYFFFQEEEIAKQVSNYMDQWL